MNELALFAGAGGGILGGKLLGWRTVCAVEREPYAASVLAQRQNDGLLPAFPIWDDVCTFDGKPWRGVVDVVSGGFPCQDISAAGKGAGIDGERSGLWGQMARIVGEVRPRFVFVENSPLLVGRGLVRVLADLAQMGFDARWGVIGAADVGAPHRRERCWVVAHAERAERRQELRPCDRLAREDGLPQRQESAGRSGACGEELADADSQPWNEGREGYAAQEPGGRDVDRGRERTEDMADTNGERQQELHAPPSQVKHDNIPGALLRDGEKAGGALNPTWVEWLMGWPLGWTDLKPLVTGKCRNVQQRHGGF